MLSKSFASVALIALLCGCRSGESPKVRDPATGIPASGYCTLGPATVDSATLAGLSVRATIAGLRDRCPRAQMETLTVTGGVQEIALRIDIPGAQFWAIQSQYEDSLRVHEPPDRWLLKGDSLRFAGGQPLPRRLGELRAFNDGVLVADKRDDSDGVYVVLCRLPNVAFSFGYDVPTPSDTGSWPLRQPIGADSTSMWQIELYPMPPSHDSSFPFGGRLTKRCSRRAI